MYPKSALPSRVWSLVGIVLVCPAILLHRVFSHIVGPILLFPVQASIHCLVRFTTCEFYMAYADYQQMMNITEAGSKRCRVASEEGGIG